jgi:hypothetical protein
MTFSVKATPRHLLWFALLLVIVGVVFFLRPPRPLEYGGKSLPQWLEDLYKDRESPEAKAAIIFIATNHVPELLRRMDYDPEPRRQHRRTIAFKLPAFIRQSQIIDWWIFRDNKEVDASDASFALRLAGRSAASAVPRLRKLALQTNCLDVAIRAMYTLPAIDADPAPLLISAVSSPNRDTRWAASGVLLSAPEIADEVVRVFVAQAKGTTTDNAVQAVDTLREFGVASIYSNRCFDAIREAAQDPRPAVRQAAERALARSPDSR